MYLIGHKGVRIAVNREASVETITGQLSDLTDQQLVMVSDYIRGLVAADTFLNRT